MTAFSELPTKIRDALIAAGYGTDDFHMALKTAYKPNATVPIVWLVLIRHELLLCTTHRTRWVWKRFDRENFNCARIKQLSLSPAIEIVSNDIADEEITLPMPVATSGEDLRAFIQGTTLIRKDR